jgi:hypothetical protein
MAAILVWGTRALLHQDKSLPERALLRHHDGYGVSIIPARVQGCSFHTGRAGRRLPSSSPVFPEFFPRTRCDGLRLVTSSCGSVLATVREFGRSPGLRAHVDKPQGLQHRRRRLLRLQRGALGRHPRGRGPLRGQRGAGRGRQPGRRLRPEQRRGLHLPLTPRPRPASRGAATERASHAADGAQCTRLSQP